MWRNIKIESDPVTVNIILLLIVWHRMVHVKLIDDEADIMLE